MNWVEDDEMMRQWEDVSKEEENISVRNWRAGAYEWKGCKNGTRDSGISSVNKRKGADEGEEEK